MKTLPLGVKEISSSYMAFWMSVHEGLRDWMIRGVGWFVLVLTARVMY